MFSTQLLIVVGAIGIVVILVFTFIAMLIKSYVKAPPNRAFVRAGGFGGSS